MWKHVQALKLISWLILVTLLKLSKPQLPYIYNVLINTTVQDSYESYTEEHKGRTQCLPIKVPKPAFPTYVHT